MVTCAWSQVRRCNLFRRLLLDLPLFILESNQHQGDYIMAVVRGPALSIQASGNVGDVNFTNWKGLSVARSVGVYSDPETQIQIDQRARLTFVAEKWGTALDADERELWNQRAMEEVFTARLGLKYIPSGYQLYMKMNLQSRVFGGDLMLVPPERVDPVYVWRNRVWSGVAGDRVNITLENAPNTKIDADGFEMMRAGPYTSGGRRPIEPEYRYLAIFTTGYKYTDLEPSVGEWYWYKTRWFFEVGYVGNWWEGQVLLEAA